MKYIYPTYQCMGFFLGTWVFEDVNQFVGWQAQRAETSPSGGVFSQTEEVKSFINQ